MEVFKASSASKPCEECKIILFRILVSCPLHVCLVTSLWKEILEFWVLGNIEFWCQCQIPGKSGNNFLLCFVMISFGGEGWSLYKAGSLFWQTATLHLRGELTPTCVSSLPPSLFCLARPHGGLKESIWILYLFSILGNTRDNPDVFRLVPKRADETDDTPATWEFMESHQEVIPTQNNMSWYPWSP